MNPEELIQAISVQNVDVDHFVELIIHEDRIRDEVIKQMITHPHIMVYYNCYEVVSKASQERPDLFMPYWHEIAPLLNHKNSYHRNIALTILANLTPVDQDNLFIKVFDNYFEHIHDKKFETGRYCVKNSLKIIKSKPELQNQIIALLLNVDHLCSYPEKQKELLKSDVLEILDEFYYENDNNNLNKFIKACAHSISPKTMHKAKDLVVKYGL